VGVLRRTKGGIELGLISSRVPEADIISRRKTNGLGLGNGKSFTILAEKEDILVNVGVISREHVAVGWLRAPYFRRNGDGEAGNERRGKD